MDVTSCAKFHLAVDLLLRSQEVTDYIKGPNSAFNLVYCNFIKFNFLFSCSDAAILKSTIKPKSV